MDKRELEQYFESRNMGAYERSNYDKFLSDMHFDFDIPSIHITGTNGKGSTANYIYQIYLSKGYKVGLYNSPYLSDVTEMISSNGRSISFDEFNSLFSEYKDIFEKYNLTAFELQTYIAYEYFKRQKLDLVIIEVGMGGFIDATNIINPILSIITSISFEHTAYLGATISEIAYNKAGIIKHGAPALVGKLPEPALYAIRERIKEVETELNIVEGFYNEKLSKDGITFDYRPYQALEISTKAFYECNNAALAVAATSLLKNKFPIDEESVRKGLLTRCLDCRFEYIDKDILLDGAHNPEAIEYLVNTLSRVESRPVHVVFASFRDKNIEKMFCILGSLTTDINITTFKHKRAREEMDYFLYLGDYKFFEDYKALIKNLKETYPGELILITGSLAFTGVVRDYLKNEK